MPPVSAQNRKAIAVRLLIVVADDDFFFPKNKVTLSALAADLRWALGNTPVRTPGASYALGNVNADFGIRG